MPDLLVWPVNLKMAASYARSNNKLVSFCDRIEADTCSSSNSKSLLYVTFRHKRSFSDIVIRCKRCSQHIMM